MADVTINQLTGQTPTSTDIFPFSTTGVTPSTYKATLAQMKTAMSLNNVEDKSSATIRSEITSSNVTTALGYTPYNSTNPAGYISSVPPGGIVKVNQTVKTDAAVCTTTSYVDIPGMSVSIAPSKTSNKILVMVNASIIFAQFGGAVKLQTNSSGSFQDIYIGSGGSSENATIIGDSDSGDTGTGTFSRNSINTMGTVYLHSPNTTSTVTYKLVWRSFGIQPTPTAGSYNYLNRTTAELGWRVPSSITVMEIAG